MAIGVKKFRDLPSLTTVASGDVLAIVDVSVNQSKFVSVSNLLSTGGAVMADGSVAMTGNLDMGGNDITNVGNVDGRDVSSDGSTLDTHVADTSNPHSTDLANLGTGLLADLNNVVTDATLDDQDDTRLPERLEVRTVTVDPSVTTSEHNFWYRVDTDAAGGNVSITLDASVMRAVDAGDWVYFECKGTSGDVNFSAAGGTTLIGPGTTLTDGKVACAVAVSTSEFVLTGDLS